MAKIKLPKWLDEIWGKCNRGETVFRRFRKTIVVEANPSPSYTRTSKQDRVRRAYRYALDDYRKLSPEQREVYKLKGYRFNLPAYQMYMKERIPFYLRILDYYKVIIDNSNNGNDLTDFQVLLSVNNDSEFFSTIENKTYIEVYDEDGKTLLPFWIELWDETNYNAKIWIKVPLIKANSVKTIFLVANKDRTVSLSNGRDVFIAFDDFEYEDDPTNHGWKWIVKGTDDSFLTTNETARHGSRCAKMIDNSTDKLPLIVLEFPTQYSTFIAEIYAKVPDVMLAHHNVFYDKNGATAEWGKNQTIYHVFKSNGYLTWYDTEYHDYMPYETNKWYDFKLVIKPHIQRYDIYVDGELKVTDAVFRVLSDNVAQIGIAGAGTSATGYFYVDLFKVRKFADPEPTVTYSKIK